MMSGIWMRLSRACPRSYDPPTFSPIFNHATSNCSNMNHIIWCILYSGSPKIDTPKIDTFFKISRNFGKTRKYLLKKIQNIYNLEYIIFQPIFIAIGTCKPNTGSDWNFEIFVFLNPRFTLFTSNFQKISAIDRTQSSNGMFSGLFSSDSRINHAE